MSKTQKLVQHIQQLIETDTLKPETKLPSLRSQAKISGNSLITVLNAYQILESKGFIYSKSKVGYFVSYQSSLQNKPVISLQPKIKINSFIFHYLHTLQNYSQFQFGSAFIHEQLIYHSKFGQLLSKYAKEIPHQTNMPPGNLELRQQIAIRYTLNGITTRPEDLIITSGALEALNLALQATTQYGDYILLQDTLFYGAWQAAEKLGLNVVTIPAQFTIEQFKTALTTYPIKVCWFMLNQQNPMSFTTPSTVKEKIAELLHQYNVYLIEDDAYQELYSYKQRPHSVKYFDHHERVLHCSSFSKVLGANARIGWVHSHWFAEKIQHLQLMSTIAASPLSQKALAKFLSLPTYDQHLNQIRNKLRKNKAAIYSFLQQYMPSSCYIHMHLGGYFIWIELPHHLKSLDIFQTLLQYHIVVAPSELFSIDPSLHHFIRINCSMPFTTEVEKALKTIVDVIYTALN